MSMPPPLPMPGVFGPGPVPGITQTAPPPKDKFAQVAELLGQVKADTEVGSADKFAQGLKLMEEAARENSQFLPLFQKVQAALNETPPPQGPPGGGMMGPQPPGMGMPLGQPGMM